MGRSAGTQRCETGSCLLGQGVADRECGLPTPVKRVSGLEVELDLGQLAADPAAADVSNVVTEAVGLGLQGTTRRCV